MEPRPDVSDKDQWDAAKAYAAKYSGSTPLFMGTVRAIRSGPAILKTDSEAEIRAFAIKSASFLVRVAPSLQAAFYFAAEERDHQELGALRPLNHEKLLGLFSPDEICAVITLLPLVRRLASRCDADEWQRFAPKLGVHMLLGGLLGEHFRHVGHGNGLLIGGLRYMALGCFLAHAVKPFRDMRRKTERDGKLFDIAEEVKLYGCSHLHVASQLASTYGYGIGPRLALALSSRMPGVERIPPSGVDSQEVVDAWKAAMHCVHFFHEKGYLTEEQISRYSPWFSSDIGDQLRQRAGVVLEHKAGCGWIWKKKSDLPGDVCAELGIAGSMGADAHDGIG